MIHTDYLVVGCGLSGLYCCYKNLLDKSFLIVDKNNYIGGRAQTVDFHEIPVQLGAGVIRDHDTNIRKLLQELNIPTKSFQSSFHFSYLDFYKNSIPNGNDLLPLFNKMTKQIKQTYENNKHNIKNISFRNFLELYFDSNFVDKYINTSIYHDYLDASVEKTIQEYPLDEILHTKNHTYYYIPDGGWRVLRNKLLEYIHKDKIKLDHELVKVIYNGKQFECHFQNNTIIYCKKLIFTADLSIKNIEFININPTILNSIGSVNFIRSYTFHDTIGLSHNYKSNSILDKIMPIHKNILMACYSEGNKAIQAKELLLDNPNKLENINRLLKNTLDTKSYNISPATDILTKYWTHGIHYYKPNYNLDQRDLNKKGLYFLGEMCSNSQGWVEGAIQSINNHNII